MQQEADALFDQGDFAEAMPLYSQLVSLHPSDYVLNYKLGTCVIYSGEDKESAIGFLEYSLKGNETPSDAWFYLGRARQLTYRFKEALNAYDKFINVADRKTLGKYEVPLFQSQCQSGLRLLSNIKDVRVLNKLEVAEADFFRYYDLDDIGGRIVVTPDELKSSIDKKKGLQTLVYLPDNGGPIYFASYGKDDSNGKDIYHSQLRPDGSFMTPVRLPATINSPADEDYAFLHPDGKTFYFSSKGHSSMGGYDVFKSSYERGTNSFGEPENMDFAINTPDDDILYLVDPSGSEACFASARQSVQGSIHVYRVQTELVPLTLTILKGSYASEIDPLDTDARIVVEDALTKEIIGEYNTDNDGSYIISVPRSGRYNFIVTPASSGNTHLGVVEFPRSADPNAYSQELNLVMQGAQEKLIIKNYFDTPLDEDLLELAQEEIRRRALLNVNGPGDDIDTEPIVDADPLREAGFGPDKTMDDVLVMAAEQSRLAVEETERLALLKEQAYGIAEEQMKASVKFKEEAEALAERADLGNGEVDESLMTEAAFIQYRSSMANNRALAAERLGVELDDEYEESQKESAELSSFKDELTKASAEDNTDKLVSMLTELKNRSDGRTPDAVAAIDLKERIRRKATEEQGKAAASLDKARASSDEENRLIDRVNRLTREVENASGGKKKDFQRDLEYAQNELAAVQQDADNYLEKAEKREKEAATARTQVELLNLLTSGRTIETEFLTPERKAQLPSDIARVEREIQELPIEERFQEEAAVQFSDMADSEGLNPTFVPDSFEIPDAGALDLTATQTIASPNVASSQTEVVDESTNVMAQVEETETSKQNPDDTSVSDEEGEGVTETMDAAGVARDRAGAETDVMSVSDFDRSNELAELRQTRAALEDPVRIDELDKRIAELESEIAAGTAVTNTEEGSATSDEAQVMVMEGYDPEMSDEELEQLLGLYILEKDEGDPTAEESYQIETRKVQMLDRKIKDQQLITSDDQVLANEREVFVSRLTALRDRHQSVVEQLDSERRSSVVDLEPIVSDEELNTSVGGDVTRSIGATETDIAYTNSVDQYITIEKDPTKVFQSSAAFRQELDEQAMQEFSRDVTRLIELREEIDSLQADLDMTDDGRAYDKKVKNLDRKIDDLLIDRAELGMRSAFLTRNERKAMVDSLAAVSLSSESNDSNGPTLLMANDYKSSSDASFDKAKRIRKQGDRAMDAAERDDLYRQAYKAELMGLQDLARAITVHKFVQSEHFVGGTENTIEEMELALFGVPTITIPVEEPAEMQSEVLASTAVSSESEDEISNEGTELAADEPNENDSTVLDEPLTHITNEPTSPIVDETAIVPSSDTETTKAAIEIDDPSVTETEEELPSQPVYEFTEAAQIERNKRIDRSITDAQILDEISAKQELVESKTADAERVSLEAEIIEARALHLEDSASTLSKKKSARVMEEVSALRSRAEVLNAEAEASLSEVNKAKATIEDLRGMQETYNAFGRFYYLSGDDHNLLSTDEDRYKYFEARARAMELMADAEDKEITAQANLTLSEVYQNQAKDLLAQEDASDPEGNEELLARVKNLNEMADRLTAEANTLRQEAESLRILAVENDDRADAMLERMEPNQLASIMKMELRILTEPSDAPAEELVTVSEQAAPVSTEDEDRPEDAVSDELVVEPQDSEDLNSGEDRLIADIDDSAVAESTEPVINARDTIQANETEDVAEVEAVTASDEPTPDPLDLAMDLMPGQAVGREQARVEEPVEETVDVTSIDETPIDNTPIDNTPVDDTPVDPISSTAGMLMADVFYINDTPVEGREIPINEVMPRGVVFRVQVGAFSKRLPTDLYGDLDPVSGVELDNGLVRYSAGMFMTYDGANEAKRLVRSRGYSDAFVVAYLNGNRVTIAEANEQLSIDRPELMPSIPLRDDVSASENVQENASSDDVSANGAVSDDGIEDNETSSVAAETPAGLEKYDMSDLNTDYGDDPNAAPADKVETIKGLFFTVQVGVYSKPVELDKLFNITPLNTELIRNSMIRYTTGRYQDLSSASSRKEETRALGVGDAFVTAYMNGKRIPVGEAQQLLEQHGPSILAAP